MTGVAGVGLIVTATTFEVAGLPLAHDTDDVRLHVTWSPLAKAELVNTELFVPATEPLTNHVY